ncbi:hypothetical protein GCM10025864_37410 [Luteimicrobium album]|uniref:SGNH hydrolase-type esterase domain-containing protein n=1 Tax=Luteimicrobium album TaxID=1054550 RepID=A0ABQ6I6Y3_9MICO|nr:GDSL-type esterase/lipase family protein [Luteimicrobium album]GMA25982.1 hypothetical protein GCM10025864_37410 [Luteimicrobium album]
MTFRDVRVCALGDSYVAGVGDPQHLGWVRRLAARTHTGGPPLTVYDLGVRRDTLADVAARWRRECDPRLPPGCEGRVLVAGGVNDTTAVGDGVRVAPDDAVRHLRTVTSGARERGWQVLVVGRVHGAGRARRAGVDDLARRSRRAVRRARRAVLHGTFTTRRASDGTLRQSYGLVSSEACAPRPYPGQGRTRGPDPEPARTTTARHPTTWRTTWQTARCAA